MRLRLVAAFACGLSVARAQTATESAIGLYQAKYYSAAEAALEKIVAAEPHNAAACYYLGLSFRQPGSGQSLDQAASWLERAAGLEPGNAAYVADYGEACLLLAGQKRSLHYALRGRDTLKRAIELNPGHLNARSSLMEFYARAPWPWGSSGAALDQAREIARRDPGRGLRAFLRLGQIFEKGGNRAAAGTACKEALKLDPGNATVVAALARLGSQPGSPAEP